MTCLTLLYPNKRGEENSPLQPFQNLYWWVSNNVIRPHKGVFFFFLKMKGIPWICIFIFLFFHLFNVNYHLTAAVWFLLSSAFDYYLLLYCSSISKTQIFHNHLVLPSAAFTGKYTKTIGMKGCADYWSPVCQTATSSSRCLLPPDVSATKSMYVWNTSTYWHFQTMQSWAITFLGLKPQHRQRTAMAALQAIFLSCAEVVVLCLPMF